MVQLPYERAQVPRQRRTADEPRAASPRGLRLLVVDDHRAFAQALAAGLSASGRFSRIDIAHSAAQADEYLRSAAPDVLLLDVALRSSSGLDLIDGALQRCPELVVLMLSGAGDTEDVVCALERGASAYVPKDVSLSSLLDAVDDALAGRRWLPADLLGPVLDELLSGSRTPSAVPSFVDDLTPRQIEVFDCLGMGMSRTEIAEHLVLSPHTVRTHVQDILRRAEAHSTLSALAIAREAGYEFPSAPDRPGAGQG